MAVRVGKTTANGDSSSDEKSSSRNRYILGVLSILIFLGILEIKSEQVGLKGLKGSMTFSTSLNSAATTLFKSPSAAQWIVEDDYFDDDQTEEEYLQWLLDQRRQIGNWTRYVESLKMTTDNTASTINVLYRAMAGLGHQLLRMSSAYHLLSIYQIPLLWPTANPVCGGSIFTIYEHLIGEGPILVDVPYLKPHNAYDANFVLPARFPNLEYVNETLLSETEREALDNYINLNNEVPSYSHSMKGTWDRDLPEFEKMEFFHKFQTDYQMYHQLMLLFGHKHQERIQEITKKTRFENHTVFALHIRTGNGEKGDFELKQRGMGDLDQWMVTVMELFCEYQEENARLFAQKPLMFFVGTDTGSVVPKLQDISSSRCQIPVVSADQAYPEEGGSVSFLQKYDDDEQCLQGWENMFLDMYFFTKANTVVTGSYSSFTQAAPMSFVMHKAKGNFMKKITHPHYFCELGPLGNRMDCYQEMVHWLKRIEAKSYGNTSSPYQRVKQELPFPNFRVKSIGVAKLFEKTVLKEVKTGGAITQKRKSLNRLTFQEWWDINGNNTSSASKANFEKAGIQGIQRNP